MPSRCGAEGKSVKPRSNRTFVWDKLQLGRGNVSGHPVAKTKHSMAERKNKRSWTTRKEPRSEQSAKEVEPRPSSERRLPQRLQWFMHLEQHYLLSVVKCGTKVRNSVDFGTDDDTFLSVVSFPLTAFFKTGYFLGFSVLGILNCVFTIALALRCFSLDNNMTIRSAKLEFFSILSPRDSWDGAPNLSNLGFLQRDCSAAFLTTMTVLNTSKGVVMHFDSPVTVNALVLEGDHDARWDAVEFRLFVHEDREHEMLELGPPKCWHCLSMGDQAPSAWRVNDGAIWRDGRLEFHFRELVPDLWLKFVVRATVAVTWTIAAVNIFLRRSVGSAMTVFRLGSGACAALATVAIGVQRHGGGSGSGWAPFLAVSVLLCATLMPRVQPVYHHMLWASGAVYLVLRAVIDPSSVSDPKVESVLFWQELAGCVAMVVGGLATARHRAGVLRQALREAKSYKSAFDRAFASIAATDAGLPDLKELVEMRSDELGQAAPQHAMRVLFNGELFWQQFLTKNSIQSLKPTLDQLFIQAATCRIILRSVIEGLGSTCHAKRAAPLAGFPDSNHAFTPLQPPGSNAHVTWTDLKEPSHALDKAQVLYHGDLTRVVDMCRETVVFERCLDLQSFLQKLFDSPSLVVVRLTSSMEPSSHIRSRTGFRGVVVNLRFVSDLARSLAVEQHVCELVLVLEPIALCMSEEEARCRRRLRALETGHALFSAGEEVSNAAMRLWRWLACRHAAQPRGEGSLADTNAFSVRVEPRPDSKPYFVDNEEHADFDVTWSMTPVAAAARSAFLEARGVALDDSDPSLDNTDSEANASLAETTVHSKPSPGRSPPSASRTPPRAGRPSCEKLSGPTEALLASHSSRPKSGHAQVQGLVGSSSRRRQMDLRRRLAARMLRREDLEGQQRLAEGEPADGERESVRAVEQGAGVRHCVAAPASLEDEGFTVMSPAVHHRARHDGAENCERGAEATQPQAETAAVPAGPAADCAGGTSANAPGAGRGVGGGEARGRAGGGADIAKDCSEDAPAGEVRGSETPLELRIGRNASYGRRGGVELASSLRGSATALAKSVWRAALRSQEEHDDAQRAGSGRNLDTGGMSSLGGMRSMRHRQELRTKSREAFLPARLGLGMRFFSAMLRTRVSTQRIQSCSSSIHLAMANTGQFAVFGTSQPIAAALTKPLFPRLCLLAGVAFVAASVAAAVEFARPLRHATPFLRLQARQLRNGSDSAAMRVGRVGILRDGCPLPVPEPSGVTASADSVILHLPEGATFDGVYFQTSHAAPEFDPVVFCVHASDDGVAWRPLASSRRVLRADGSLDWLSAPMEVPLARGTPVLLHFHVTLQEAAHLFQLPVAAVALLAAAALAWAKRPLAGRWLVVATAVACCILRVTTAVNWDGAATRLPSHFLLAGNLLAVALVTLCREELLLEAGASLLWVTVAVGLAESQLLHGRVADFRAPLHTLLAGAVFNAVLAARWLAQRRARLLITEDSRQYAELWEALLEDEEARAGIARVEAAIKSIDLPWTPGSLRQLQDLWGPACGGSWHTYNTLSESFFRPGILAPLVQPTEHSPPGSARDLRPQQLVCREPSVEHFGRRESWFHWELDSDAFLSRRRCWAQRHWNKACVADLDTLYAMAAGTLPILHKKVEQWALEADGYFEQQGGGFAPCREILRTASGESSEQDRVKRGTLKNPQRAVEKLNRSYGSDVSKLLDVCRDCMVFQSCSALAKCIRVIACDAEVEIVAVKNRLSKRYNATATCGYRDVNLVLRMRTPEARRLRLDLHLCELQLILMDFALLKSDQGHRRYVAFRNARAQ